MADLILVVEDHDDTRASLALTLEMAGYDVKVASDGLQAIRVLQEMLPDLILADIMMPHLDGYGLFDRVQCAPDYAKIPFIFLTAKGDVEDIRLGRRLGADDYLVKPVERDDVLAAVEGKLRRSRALHAATRADVQRLKKQIIGVVSHELRTPLTYIVGYGELLQKTLEYGSPEQFAEFLRGLQVGTDRLRRLIDDLVLLFELEAGLAQDVFQRFRQPTAAWLEALRALGDEYADLATQRQVRVQFLLPDNPPVLTTYVPFLRIAVEHLLRNGINFSPPQSVVTVSARAADSWLEVAVTDQGPGIPAAELARIFEPFYQVGREEQEQQGLGIGLAIVQRCAELHNGTVEVASELGKGSVFTLRFPLEAADDGDAT